MKLPLRAPRSSGGFTLIEILVAMGILLVGMTSVLGLLAFGAQLSRLAAQRGESAAAVEAVFADLEERMFPLIVVDGETRAGEPVPIENQPLPGFPGLTYSARAALDEGHAKELGPPYEYRVDVEIAWTTGGRRKSRTFTSLLVGEVPFGERLRQMFVQPAPPPAAAVPSSASPPKGQ